MSSTHGYRLLYTIGSVFFVFCGKLCCQSVGVSVFFLFTGNICRCNRRFRLLGFLCSVYSRGTYYVDVTVDIRLLGFVFLFIHAEHVKPVTSTHVAWAIVFIITLIVAPIRHSWQLPELSIAWHVLVFVGFLLQLHTADEQYPRLQAVVHHWFSLLCILWEAMLPTSYKVLSTLWKTSTLGLTAFDVHLIWRN
jgi:hypothetical protein